MAAEAPSTPCTIDDLEQFPDDGKLRELVDGQMVEWDVTNDALVRILGSAYHARGADIAFFSRGRIPKDRRAPATAVTPDLVIEILAPSDRAAEVQAKVRDWLRAGVRLLWYVDPVSGSTAVHAGDRLTYVEAGEALEGGPSSPASQSACRRSSTS